MASRAAPQGKLTFVFTDIAASTRMTAALGSAVYREAMLAPHNQRIRHAITEHDGYEFKTMGDAFMVAFERADDALAYAVAIQQALVQPAITATDPQGNEWTIRVRIGVHTAQEELCPDDKGDYHGDDVNFAARVESLGAGGQIIAHDSTYRAAGSATRYQWQEWPNRRLKSFDQPEIVWELLWDGQAPREPGARWFPDWFFGEPNEYIQRPDRQDEVLAAFAERGPDRSGPRLVTLHGSGGMGKTRLAVACAIQAAGLFEGGVHLVLLEEKPKTQEAVAEAIAAAMEITGEAALPDNLLAALRETERLLILDNYESVDCAAVARFLGRLVTETSGVHLLVTGREAVKLTNLEQVIPLEKGMTDEEAQELFLARARLRKGQSWQPDASEREQVARIAELTGSIPLAIELAAAWADRRALEEIADGIAATPLGPPRPGHAIIERHASLTRCLDWSFDLLQDWAQEGFASLGVFADSFSPETVAAICRRDAIESRPAVAAQDLLDRL